MQSSNKTHWRWAQIPRTTEDRFIKESFCIAVVSITSKRFSVGMGDGGGGVLRCSARLGSL